MARGFKGFNRNKGAVIVLPEDITTTITAQQYHSMSWGLNAYSEPVDLTHVKTIVVTGRYYVSFPSSGGQKQDYWSGSQHLFFLSQQYPDPQWGDNYAFWLSTSGDYTPVTIDAPHVWTYDVSDLKGLYYIGCGANNTSPYHYDDVRGYYWAYTYINNVHFE